MLDKVIFESETGVCMFYNNLLIKCVFKVIRRTISVGYTIICVLGLDGEEIATIGEVSKFYDVKSHDTEDGFYYELEEVFKNA